MKLAKRRESPVVAGLFFALLAVLWFLFAPVKFGGRTSYVIVNGISMEPKFHKGDLALVRTSSSYNVGDIVVYRHPTIGPVIHRVIGKDGDTFIFQGDNNDFVDSYHPTQAELIGKFWFHIPAIGKPFTKLRNRFVIAGMVALSGIILLLPMAVPPSRKRRSRREWTRGERRELVMTSQSDNGQTMLTVLVAVALASLALGFLAFRQPLTRSVPATADYQQAGTFSYSASGPSTIYDSATVTTGDPVYPQVTNNVDVRFEYHLTSDQTSNLSGTAELDAEVSDATGWKRTIVLLQPAPFKGNAFIALGTLDLSQVNAVIDQFQQSSGVVWPQYTVSIVPHVQIAGSLAGEKLADSFVPSLKFRLDQHELQMLNPSSSNGNSNTSVLQPTKSGQVAYTLSKASRMSLLKFSFDTAKVRVIAIVALLLSLIGLAIVGLMSLRGKQIGEAERIRTRFGAMLVTVDDADFENTSRVIDVTTFDDLLRLAMRDERMIMHQFAGEVHRYYVQENTIVYRYRVEEQSEQPVRAGNRSRVATGELR
ncbi:MAG: signal peptidase I [Nitrolancea sp.]